MSTIPVNLAIEDELSEAVLRRLLADAGRGYEIGTAYRRGGFGYLKKTIGGWNNAARGTPFIVLTDLDAAECPQELIAAWLSVPRHPNLIVRVAVREVESWLLADTVQFSNFLKISPNILPLAPDSLPDPKRVLIQLARKSQVRDLRESLVPRQNSTAQKGPDYNACLARFVQTSWNSKEASSRSPSLLRTVNRLREFTPAY